MKCAHLDQVRDVAPSAEGCEECLKIGSRSGHPIARSREPGESWSWCYVDEGVLA